MGFFNFLKRDKGKKVQSIVKSFYGGDYNYFVWNYANNIYSIPEVRIAIETIANMIASMNKWHKKVSKNGKTEYLEGNTNRIINFVPSPLQNSAQFYKNAVTQLLLENNCFIEPIFDKASGKLNQLYTLPNKVFQLSMDANNQNAYVQFYDTYGNSETKYNLKNIIYINRFCTLSGGQKNELGLFETVLKSLMEQIVNIASPNKPRAILQSDTVGEGQLKERDKKGATEELKANFAKNVHGIAYLDKKWKITPIAWTDNDVNEKLMKFITNEVYNYFGINESIINSKATEIEMSLFISNTIKPIAKQFEEEFTNKLFTENEFYFGHRIEFDTSSIQVSTLQSKGNLTQTCLRNGVMNIDEARELLFGLPPLEKGLGSVYRTSADLVNVKVVDSYQLGKVNIPATKEISPTEKVVDINIKKGGDNGK